MREKRSVVRSLWFSILMSVVSLGMFAEYARLVLTSDDSPRKIFAMGVWLLMAVAWVAMAVVRHRNRG